MATKTFYDGPGVYDEPYQIREARANLLDTVRLLKTDEAKLRGIDGFLAVLTDLRARVVAGTETDEELYGPQYTVLASGEMTTLPPTRP